MRKQYSHLFLHPLFLAFVCWWMPLAVQAGPKSGHAPRPALYVSFIDQLPPQVGPSINGLDERRRGPIFARALQQCVNAGKLPTLVVINPDLGLAQSLADEPKVPAGKTLLRIYLTQWSHTRSGGPADTEILCRFFAEVVRDGHVQKKLGPFFARKIYNVDIDTPEERWAQYQGVALAAINEMVPALDLRSVL
jgi:hypothetical protein